MANNRIQVKRTSTTGRTANVTNSGNSQYINAGELALNMADGILYSSNGSALIEVGANNTNARVSGTLTVNAISANGGFGTAGQVLHSNGTSAYWAADDNSGGTVTSVGSGNGLTGGPITTTGTLAVGAGNGITVNATAVAINANTGIIANTTGVFVNATYIGTLSANNSSFLGGTAAASYQLNSTLAANVAILTANNANNLGGVAASSYQTTAGLSANVATLTSNNATNAFGKTEGALNVNSSTTASTSNNSSFLGGTAASGYQTTAGLSANVATLTANNSNNLGGQLPAFYTNATNITTGTLPYAQIPVNVINTTAAFTRTGVTTFSANVVLGSSGVSANGGFGTAGQVLSSNGSAAYWATSAGGSSAVATSDTAPDSPTDGTLWWNSTLGKMFIYYDDGSSAQWVETSPVSVTSNNTNNTTSSSVGFEQTFLLMGA